MEIIEFNSPIFQSKMSNSKITTSFSVSSALLKNIVESSKIVQLVSFNSEIKKSITLISALDLEEI